MIDRTRKPPTFPCATLFRAAVGTLDLTGTITNNGEIDATTGTLDLENAIVNGGTLGGPGTIATATGNIDSTLNGVTIGRSEERRAGEGSRSRRGAYH